MRRFILAAVKLRSRLFTALNFEPSMATLASDKQARSRRHSVDELRADLAKRAPRCPCGSRRSSCDREPDAHQPHHLHVAARFAFQTTARLHPVQIAVDVKLQKNGGMIGRPPRLFRINAPEPQPPEVKPSTNASITRTGFSSAIQSSRHSRKKRPLTPIKFLDKTASSDPSKIMTEESQPRSTFNTAFLHSQGQTATYRSVRIIAGIRGEAVVVGRKMDMDSENQTSSIGWALANDGI